MKSKASATVNSAPSSLRLTAVQLVLIIQAISHAVAAECPVDAQAAVAREVTRRTIPC